MKRKMFSIEEKCNANCMYCFSKWPNYNEQEHFTIEKMEQAELIYPSCDSEFFKCKNNILKLENFLTKETESIKILNISTKFKISENIIKEIKKINEMLIINKEGYIKIGISISNLSQIDNIENGTSNIYDRINNLKLLKQYNIPRIVIIKPILPFIGVEEYKKIIDLTKEYVDVYLIGDLYVNLETKFYKDYIKDKYKVDERIVNWLDSKPKWNVVESVDIKEKLKEYIVLNNKVVYNSDLDCIQYYSRMLLNK